MTVEGINNLKRKLRKLKQFEKTARMQAGISNDMPLVWDKFFDTHDIPNNTALYSLKNISVMNKDEYKSIVDDFFARVYYEIYAYKGITDETIYDTDLLAQLDLPPVADSVTVKKKFRELAKLYHPDTGGDAAKFIGLMEIYKKLIE